MARVAFRMVRDEAHQYRFYVNGKQVTSEEYHEKQGECQSLSGFQCVPLGRKEYHYAFGKAA
jgi:hypothetical protein